jgi:hypothetical protein
MSTGPPIYYFIFRPLNCFCFVFAFSRFFWLFTVFSPEKIAETFLPPVHFLANLSPVFFDFRGIFADFWPKKSTFGRKFNISRKIKISQKLAPKLQATAKALEFNMKSDALNNRLYRYFTTEFLKIFPIF